MISISAPAPPAPPEDLEGATRLQDIANFSTDRVQDSLDVFRSSESSIGLLPGLPVETIERIIKYTFLPQSRLSPTSEPFQLSDAVHLLLVSHSFHQLCIPFLYHTIVIGDGDDFVTFFDSRGGLFSGERGACRWSYVREVAIVNGAEPVPLLPPTRQIFNTPWLRPLSIPEGRGLDVLCILDGEEDGIPTDKEWAVDKLMRFMRSDEEWRSDSRELVVGANPQLYSLLDDADNIRIRETRFELEDAVDASIEQDITEGVDTERFNFWRDEWFVHLNAAELRVSSRTALDLADRHPPRTAVGYGSLINITCSGSDSDLLIGDLYRWILSLASPNVKVATVHLEKFPSSFLVGWTNAVKEERERGWDRINIWGFAYTWVLADGSLFSLPAAPSI